MGCRKPEGLSSEVPHLAPIREKTASKNPSRTILVVDDEASVLTVVTWILREAGYNVSTALGGRAALHSLKGRRFDLLITDLVMPDLGGLLLVQMAKELYPNMKVIIMTGSLALAPQILFTGHLVDGFLVKPFGLNKLRTLISECLEETVTGSGVDRTLS